MLPPIWRAQDQQVAAPGRVKEKGRPRLGLEVPSGTRQPRCRGRQAQGRVCEKASQGSKEEGLSLRPTGAAVANALLPPAV